MSCNNRHTSPLFSHHLQHHNLRTSPNFSISDLSGCAIVLLSLADSELIQSRVLLQCRCGSPPELERSHRYDVALSAMCDKYKTGTPGLILLHDAELALHIPTGGWELDLEAATE